MESRAVAPWAAAVPKAPAEFQNFLSGSFSSGFTHFSQLSIEFPPHHHNLPVEDDNVQVDLKSKRNHLLLLPYKLKLP